MPSTTISEARVTVFISIFRANMSAQVMVMVIGMLDAVIKAERMGKNISMTKITTKMATTRSRKKVYTDFPTTFGRSVIRYSCTSSGSVCWNAANCSSMRLPKVTMLFPACISTESTRAFSPSLRI